VLGTTSTVDAVVNHFLERIRTGELKPGDSLPSERVLKEQFGISRLSLREGLARLNALGVIQVRQGRGATVRQEASASSFEGAMALLAPSHDINNFEEFLEARMVIEGALTALAAERRTDEHLAALQGILDETRALHGSGRRFSEQDSNFHRTIATAASNRLLATIHHAIRRYFVVFRDPADEEAHLELVCQGHEKILECIKRQDAEAAAMAAREHLLSFVQYYRDFFATPRDRSNLGGSSAS